MTAAPSTRSVPALTSQDCLFIDLDGTLLPLQADPQGIRADAALRGLLLDCAARLGGALAIVSGRPLAAIDACLAPALFAAAGLHGLERRDFSGNRSAVPVARAPLQDAARELTKAMEDLPMTILEDKGASIALHWRMAPDHEADLRRLARQALGRVGPTFTLLEGNCVIELLPRQAGKGEAIRAFMREAPFHGRRPVMVGDDITDLSAFDAVAELGGHSIAVGVRIDGQHRLADVEAVHAWLRGGLDD